MIGMEMMEMRVERETSSTLRSICVGRYCTAKIVVIAADGADAAIIVAITRFLSVMPKR